MTEVKQEVVENANIITLNLPNPFHLNFLTEHSGNGGFSPRVVHASNITLSKGTVYQLPIKEKIDYDNFHAIKISKNFRTKLEVLDVSDSYVSLRCIIHGIVINDGDVIAELI